MQDLNLILVVFDTLRKDCVGTYGAPPWGPVQTPNLDRFAEEAVTFTRAYPESLPTLPARRALYTGERVYPFENGDIRLKGDFTGVLGWGPILEEQDTLAELLQVNGFRTGLVSDLYHQFKPSKNFWRGFDQWTFLRGQEVDTYRSGPEPSQAEIDYWLPPEMQELSERGSTFVRQCIKNMYGRDKEEDYPNARVMIEAGRWLEQNQDANRFFLTVESFDPHEPWFVPEQYSRMYLSGEARQMALSPYMEANKVPADLMRRMQANYSGLVTMCDRWFGHLYETVRTLGLLENTIIIVMSDHGHALGETNFVGKRGYPSHPACLDTVLMVRHPEHIGSSTVCDHLVQHTDVGAQILDFAGVEARRPLHGLPFYGRAVEGGKGYRDHVTVAWGTAVTVIDDRWWMNAKVDGTGVFLYDLSAADPFGANVAEAHQDVVQALFEAALHDAGGPIPDYLLKIASTVDDVPGSSALNMRM